MFTSYCHHFYILEVFISHIAVKQLGISCPKQFGIHIAKVKDCSTANNSKKKTISNTCTCGVLFFVDIVNDHCAELFSATNLFKSSQRNGTKQFYKNNSMLLIFFCHQVMETFPKKYLAKPYCIFPAKN